MGKSHSKKKDPAAEPEHDDEGVRVKTVDGLQAEPPPNDDKVSILPLIGHHVPSM